MDRVSGRTTNETSIIIKAGIRPRIITNETHAVPDDLPATGMERECPVCVCSSSRKKVSGRKVVMVKRQTPLSSCRRQSTSRQTWRLSVKRKWSRNHHHQVSHSLVHSSLILSHYREIMHPPTAASSAFWEAILHRNYCLPRMRLFSVCKVRRTVPESTLVCVCSACHTGIILLIIQEPLVGALVLLQSTIHSSQHDPHYCLPTMEHSQYLR